MEKCLQKHTTFKLDMFFQLSILVYEWWDSQLSTLILLPNKH
jgi:hypothetical protein